MQFDRTLEAAQKAILEMGIASCSCFTKSPSFKSHSETCRYRRAMEVGEALELAAAERIVAVALSWMGVMLTLPAPARHADVMDLVNRNDMPPEIILFGRQGFITSTGRFVDRLEAGTIAKGSRQLLNDAGQDGLSSKDVW